MNDIKPVRNDINFNENDINFNENDIKFPKNDIKVFSAIYGATLWHFGAIFGSLKLSGKNRRKNGVGAKTLHFGGPPV